MKNRQRSGFLVLLCLAFALSACGGGGSSEHGDQSEAVHRGGTLVVALDSAPLNLDPLMANDAYSLAVVSNVCEGLVNFTADLKIEPWLAEQVDQRDDVTYVFHLRRNVKFHDGTEMDADAVKFSMERFQKNNKSAAYADSQTISELRVIDPYTLQITLKEPSSAFLSKLYFRLGDVVSPAAVSAMGDDKFNQAPVCTGPFKVSSPNNIRVDDTLVDRFDSYWRMGTDQKPLPYLDHVEWQVITDPSTRLTALLSGRSGAVMIANIRDADAGEVKSATNLNYAQQPGIGFNALMLTLTREPFDNLALRQAVQYAINRKDIITAIYEGNREEAKGPVSPIFKWAVDPAFDPYPFDLDKAKAKLAEGGMPNGFKFTVWTTPGNPTTDNLMDLIKSQLAKVGINVDIHTAQMGEIVGKFQNKESNAYLLSFNGVTVDPDGVMSNVFLDAGVPSMNLFPYRNAEVNKSILDARKSSDPGTRGKLYKDATKLIMRDSPAILLTYAIDRYVGNKKVHNWHLGYNGTTGYSDYWITP